ncbi:hypothetical protein Salat_0071800 [Sesamum alatum]|uniref:Uncharacterized protein n=1 Tax=Sesamum alatum TaxID=300844 RepID=A0AAE1YW56_9LAMI|nr:hypothetical protein Salat_0071800 [Sesamum alatum]
MFLLGLVSAYPRWNYWWDPNLGLLKRAWKLTEDEESGMVLLGGLWHAGSGSPELCLVERLLSNRLHRFEALRTSIRNMILPGQSLGNVRREMRQLNKHLGELQTGPLTEVSKGTIGCFKDMLDSLAAPKEVLRQQRAKAQLANGDRDFEFFHARANELGSRRRLRKSKTLRSRGEGRGQDLRGGQEVFQ